MARAEKQTPELEEDEEITWGTTIYLKAPADFLQMLEEQGQITRVGYQFFKELNPDIIQTAQGSQKLYEIVIGDWEPEEVESDDDAG